MFCILLVRWAVGYNEVFFFFFVKIYIWYNRVWGINRLWKVINRTFIDEMTLLLFFSFFLAKKVAFQLVNIHVHMRSCANRQKHELGNSKTSDFSLSNSAWSGGTLKKTMLWASSLGLHINVLTTYYQRHLSKLV